MDQENVDLQIHDQNEQLKYITGMELNTIKEDIYVKTSNNGCAGFSVL